MKKIFLVLALILGLCVSDGAMRIGQAESSSGLRCKTVPESELMVLEDAEVRIGPGQNYPAIGTAQAGELLGVIGMFNQWYLVQRENGSVGLVESEKTRITQIREISLPQGGEGDQLLEEEEGAAELFQAANGLRMENGLTAFEWDVRLNRIAQAKADDMIKNNYFGHYSETYGTPFAMLKEMDYEYTIASEYIAHKTDNPNMGVFVNPAGRANILGRFDKMGVGISDGENGIIVQLFVKEP